MVCLLEDVNRVDLVLHCVACDCCNISIAINLIVIVIAGERVYFRREGGFPGTIIIMVVLFTRRPPPS